MFSSHARISNTYVFILYTEDRRFNKSMSKLHTRYRRITKSRTYSSFVCLSFLETFSPYTIGRCYFFFFSFFIELHVTYLSLISYRNTETRRQTTPTPNPRVKRYSRKLSFCSEQKIKKIRKKGRREQNRAHEDEHRIKKKKNCRVK